MYRVFVLYQTAKCVFFFTVRPCGDAGGNALMIGDVLNTKIFDLL